MSTTKIELKSAGPAGAYQAGASVRIIGSTVIARVPQFALKEPKPAVRVDK